MSTSPSISPPRTPDDHPRRNPDTPNSDDSIEDLSFDYAFNDAGEWVRMSKDGVPQDSQSTPPTPDEPSLKPDIEGSPEIPLSPMTRVSLSRSESAYAVLTGAANALPPPRSFQRVASGPGLASTPSQLPQSRSRGGVMPRRITMEDHRERPEPSSRSSRQTLELASRESYEEKENILTDEDRPNGISRRNSPPLIARSVASRARISHSMPGGGGGGGRPLAPRQAPTGLNRPGRMMKSSSSLKYSATGPLGEVVESNNNNGGDPYHSEVESHYTPAPSDTEGLEFIIVREQPTKESKTTTSCKLPRLLSLQDLVPALATMIQVHDEFTLTNETGKKWKHELNIEVGLLSSTLSDYTTDHHPFPEQARKENEGAEFMERHSPSPTHINQHHQARPSSSSSGTNIARPTIHRRRDSDTLRGLIPPNSATSLGSPTVMDAHGSRLSPTGRASPFSAKRMVVEREAAKHRRSPTAPDPSTLGGGINGGTGAGRPGSLSRQRTWANEERGESEFDPASSAEKDKGKERERLIEGERERRERREQLQSQQQPQTQQPSQIQSYAQSQSLQVSISQSQSGSNVGTQPLPAPKHIVVNRKAYARLDLIGKGGSSRVFRVLNHANELYAIKRVSLDKTDAETMSGYMNEIALLKRLEGNNRIIRLIDSEVKPGPGGSKGHLLLVMECGEVDFSRLLQEQMNQPLNMVWVSYYWQQMLQAVHVIHEEKIVHSDLKPANFVLVKGQLKLIDFGIANAIANDTTNIQRDHQIGTVNFMSPEAIELPDGMRRLKVGRPSDVWSLGIILYQMVYGYPPFQHLSVYQKMKAIPDGHHAIDYPDYATPCVPVRNSSTGGPPPLPQRLEEHKRRVRPDVISAMKSCLERQPKERATIPELLDLEWLGLRAELAKEEKKTELKELLGPEETVINPHYMRQLLEYGMKMAAHQGTIDVEKEATRLVAELKSVHMHGTGP
ncbi:other/TTK protein kinase [Coprinopsis sp. MPI-PUGE-AT-0042]|nr:other/TTK protein kinase [Coprinopsis sp. MPI-PUGE-AT-0042]